MFNVRPFWKKHNLGRRSQTSQTFPDVPRRFHTIPDTRRRSHTIPDGRRCSQRSQTLSETPRDVQKHLEKRPERRPEMLRTAQTDVKKDAQQRRLETYAETRRDAHHAQRRPETHRDI